MAEKVKKKNETKKVTKKVAKPVKNVAVTSKSKRNSNKLTKQLKPGVSIEIISGKHKGKKTEIVKINRKRNLVYSEGINEIVDYQKSIDGGKAIAKVKKIMGINISNIKVI